jgi:hypothetical protein
MSLATYRINRAARVVQWRAQPYHHCLGQKAAEAEFDSHIEMNPVMNMKDNKKSSSEVIHFRLLELSASLLVEELRYENIRTLYANRLCKLYFSTASEMRML